MQQDPSKSQINPHRGLNQRFNRSGSFDRSEARSAELLAAMNAAVKAATESQDLVGIQEIYRFDRDENRVGLPAVLVVKSAAIEGVGNVTAVRAILVNTPTINLTPLAQQNGTVRHEAQATAKDAYTANYFAQIEAFLTRQFGQPPTVYDAGAISLPVSFDLTDPQAVMAITMDSINRCDDVLARVSREQPFKASELRSDNERLVARIDFTGAPRFNIAGLPVRSDITVSMSRAENAKPQYNGEYDPYQDPDRLLNSVSAYVNLEYLDPMARQQAMAAKIGMQNMGMINPESLPPWQPTIVITEVAQAPWILAKTMEMYFLAFSNAYRATNQMAWARVLLPRMGVKGVDIKDIGAIGYLTPSKKMIDTKSDSFKETDFTALMRSMVNPSPVFVLDIDPVGENSGIESYILEAAGNGPNASTAAASIVAALDNLTDKRFSTKFKELGGDKLFVLANQEVDLGYYTAADGEVRDIRDLDTIAVLNQTKTDDAAFLAYYGTLCDPNMGRVEALSKRANFERQYLRQDLVITGRAQRVYATEAFIVALDKAVAESGAVVNMATDIQNVMGAVRFAGNSVVGNYAVSGTATMNYGGQQHGNVAGQGYGMATGNRSYL